VQAGLRGGVGGSDRLAAVGPAGADGDDPATRRTLRPGEEVVDEEPRQVGGPEEVDLHVTAPGRAPAGEVDPVDRMRLEDARVVHEHVEATEALDRSRHERGRGIRIGEVADDGHVARAGQ
jgi:hypothetical protein